MVAWPELVLLALSPIIFLLWFFRHKDRYKHEPIRFMAKVFFLGAILTILAVIVELVAFPIFRPDNGLLETGLFFFIIVGPIEEFAKFAAVRVRAYHSHQFDEPMDGIVLGVSAALGFATVENLADVFSAPTPEAQILVGIVRAFLSVPGHAFWGAITGFYLGQAKYLKRPSLAYVGLAIAAVLHGAFDTTTSIIDTVAGDSDAVALFGILVLAGIVLLTYRGIVRREIAEAEEESPYKDKPPLLPLRFPRTSPPLDFLRGERVIRASKARIGETTWRFGLSGF